MSYKTLPDRAASDNSDNVTFTIPRSALTLVETPKTVSQRTVEPVMGITPRLYLESLPDFEASGGSVLRLGKLRLVEVDHFVNWLRARANKSPAAATDEAPSLADELGLREVGTPARLRVVSR